MTIGESPALSEDQRALQDTLRGFLADDLASGQLRSSLDDETGYSPELHARLASEMGLCGLTIPEEFGGRGLSSVEACLVHTELGRVLYPGPFLPSYLAAEALLATGDREASKKWLPRLADGSVVGTVAAADEAGHWSSGSDSVRAEQTPGGWRLSGRRWFVIAAHVAGIVVVPAVTTSGPAIFLVESGSPGLVISRQLSLDLTRRISITSFSATPALLLSEGQDAVTALDRAERDFLLAIAAEAAGGIGWCLDASIAYVEDRKRLGRPDGSFEAEAHYCVEMLADFEAVSSAARYAAVVTAEGAADAPMAARVAALRAGQSYRGVTEAAIHLFGGIGFSRELEANLYYRRAWSAERLVGGPHAQRTAIVDLASPLSLICLPVTASCWRPVTGVCWSTWRGRLTRASGGACAIRCARCWRPRSPRCWPGRSRSPPSGGGSPTRRRPSWIDPGWSLMSLDAVRYDAWLRLASSAG